MNKQSRALVKYVACVGAAFAVVLSAGNIDSRKAANTSLSTEASLAGISLTLDDYYKAEVSVNEDGQADTEISTNVEGQAEETVPEAEEAEEEAAEPEEVSEPEETSPYEGMFDDVGISIADNYVHVRKQPTVKSKAVGKLYRGCTAQILEDNGKWVRIQSGNVNGYIKKEFLDIGIGVEDMVEEYGKKYAIVNIPTLRVREKPSTDSACLTLIPIDGRYKILKETQNGWLKILIDGSEDEYCVERTVGYVKGEYVDIDVQFKHAVSIKEERAEARRKKQAEQALYEQQQRLEQAQNGNTQSSSSGSDSSSNSGSSNNSNSSSNSGSSNNSNSSNSGSNNNSNNSSNNNSSSNQNSSDKQPAVQNPTNATGSEIASFALQFVGNPYSYGGTSLTEGADCSGFCYAVYRAFGITIPRDSRSQGAGGRAVDLDNLQPGDIILYASGGTIDHAALYIGGGNVVQAHSSDTGIVITPYNYRTPYCARRYV